LRDSAAKLTVCWRGSMVFAEIWVLVHHEHLARVRDRALGEEPQL
jgi:hypothetical protein